MVRKWLGEVWVESETRDEASTAYTSPPSLSSSQKGFEAVFEKKGNREGGIVEYGRCLAEMKTVVGNRRLPILSSRSMEVKKIERDS